MIVSSILNRSQLKITDKLHILWTPINNEFEEFIRQLGYNLIDFNQIYYGDNIPHIILCNNKVEYYNQCYSMSRRLHIPVLLIDHTIKNPLYDSEKIKQMNSFPCMHHVCVSKKIHDSWELKDAQILSYNIKDEDNINIWKNLIFQVSKKVFKV